MESASAPAQSSVAMGGTDLSPGYRLTSDIAQFCLPASSRDANRRLAYVNSICVLFLAIGLIGFREPKVVQRELPPLPEIIPVVYTPPEEQPKPEPQPRTDEPEPQPDTVVDMPQIATVVAADPSQVKFAIPVEGPVIFAPANFAQAPPPNPPKATPTFTKLVGNDGGVCPDPQYPPAALQQQLKGKVVLTIVTDTNGVPETVEVKDSSGYVVLDRHSIQWVKRKWRWPPGRVRYYYKEFEYTF